MIASFSPHTSEEDLTQDLQNRIEQLESEHLELVQKGKTANYTQDKNRGLSEKWKKEFSPALM